MVCNNCGKELKDGAKFCGYCGTKLEQKSENNTQKNLNKDNKTKKKKEIIIVSIIILLISICAIILLKFNKSVDVEEEALKSAKALYEYTSNAFELRKNIADAVGSSNNELVNDFEILEIKKIDEKKLKKNGIKIDKKMEEGMSTLKVKANDDGTMETYYEMHDISKESIFAIKYIFDNEDNIAIYIGDYKYNSTELEDLGIGSWIRQFWEEDNFTNDSIDADSIMKKLKNDNEDSNSKDDNNEDRNNLKENIEMYEWEKIGATEEEFQTMNGAEIDEKYEYILYDKNNRELVYRSGQGRTLYYKMYEEVDDYTYNVYTLSFYGMLAEPYHEEIITITSDGKGHIKDEKTIRDQAIDYEEYKQLEEKYIKYIDENKSHRKKEISYVDDSSENNDIQEKIKECAIHKMESQGKEPDDIRLCEAEIIEKDKENKYLVLVHRIIYMAYWNGEYVDEEMDFYDLVIVKIDDSGNPFIDDMYGYQGITEEFKKLDNDINMISVLSEEIKAKNNWKY